MCHIRESSLCPSGEGASEYNGAVSALLYGEAGASKAIALLPDIYGVTPFYRGLSALLSGRGATVYLVDPWKPFGDLPEFTREAAWERRHKIRDQAFCDDLAAFIRAESIDTVIGFCIGGNYLLELVRRGFDGTSCAFYPLPWGMANVEGLQPPFEYLSALTSVVTIFAGAEDPLAGPDNTKRLQDICSSNPPLDLHLYERSGHGFLADVDSADSALQANAREAMQILLAKVFPEPAAAPLGPFSTGSGL